MPSRFESDLFGTSAWGVLASPHGELVGVQPKGTTGFTQVTAIFKRDEVSDAQYEEGTEIQTRSMVRLGPDAIAAITAAIGSAWVPATGDLVQARGLTYSVEKVPALTPVLELELFKIDERRFGGGNYAKR